MEITASIKAQAADSKKYGPDSNQAKKHGGRLEFWEAEMRLLMTGEAEDEKAPNPRVLQKTRTILECLNHLPAHLPACPSACIPI